MTHSFPTRRSSELPLYTIEVREAIPRGEVNRLRLRGISRMPNERFEEFADRFVKSIGEPGCDLQKLVDELIELHAVERDEFDRVRLISMHIALTNIAAERLAEAEVSHDKIIGFLAQNLSTYHLMLRQESLVRSEERKRVVEGKGVSVGVGLGGRRSIKKQN